MPKITVDYSKNLTDYNLINPKQLLIKINQSLAEMGEFKEQNLRAIAKCNDCYVVGIHPENRAFIDVKIEIISGRSIEIKQDIVKRTLTVLQQNVKTFPGLGINFAIDIIDMEKTIFTNQVFVEFPPINITKAENS